MIRMSVMRRYWQGSNEGKSKTHRATGNDTRVKDVTTVGTQVTKLKPSADRTQLSHTRGHIRPMNKTHQSLFVLATDQKQQRRNRKLDLTTSMKREICFTGKLFFLFSSFIAE